MSSLFKKIKTISQCEKDLVVGYNKKAEKLLNLMQIPMAVSYLCLIYHYDYDHFDHLANNTEKNEKAVSPNNMRTIFGVMHILDAGVQWRYSWTFKISTVDTSIAFISIGIMSDDAQPSSYFLTTDGVKGSNCTFARNTAAGYNIYAHSIKHNKTAIVKMKINTKDRTIRYFVDGRDYGIAFRDVEFQFRRFRMCVGGGSRYCTTTIRLIEFKRQIV